VLHGAAQALLDQTGVQPEVLDDRYRQESLGQARAALGDERAQRAYARGRTAATTGIDERHIGRREREEPDQLVTVDVLERTQLLQVSIRKQPGHHRPPPHFRQTVRRYRD